MLTKDQSLRVLQWWLHLLRLRGTSVRWTFWSQDQNELCGRYALYELMGITLLYHKTRQNLETIFKIRLYDIELVNLL